MYKQERKAGFLQYLVCIISGILLWIFCDIVGILLRNNLVADILFVVLACVLVYCTYTHYCAIFIYELADKKLVITRKIGKREICEEIKLNKITGIYDKHSVPHLPKNTTSFTANLISKKNYCYLLYNKNNNCLIFEPDSKFLKLLKENING